MAMVCVQCGSYGRGSVTGRVVVCDFCGAERERPDLPFLVVTGVPASGKSLVCAALSATPGVLALDGDTLASGAHAVADGRRDYLAFWAYLWQLGLEIQDNGLIPVLCGVALPEQVLTTRMEASVPVHFLALTADEATIRARIIGRPGSRKGIDVDRHVALNEELRQSRIRAPDTLTVLDTTSWDREATVAAAQEWCAAFAAPDAALQ